MSARAAAGAPPAATSAALGVAGLRLDQAAAVFLPDAGLRERRRCVSEGRVLVNGLPAGASYRLRPEDTLSFLPRPRARLPEPAHLRPRLLARQGGYVFFYKPGGLHTASLAGGGGPSLEACLPLLVPPPVPRLLQRLDRDTSGLVCAALTPGDAAAFRMAEAAGHCEKRYLAVLQGCLDRAVTVKKALDTACRKRSRPLDRDAPPERWTEFRPLRHWRTPPAGFPETGCAGGLTLTACRIRRGARHQIRAHAALAGHPLWGDMLYGGAGKGKAEGQSLPGGRFWLHHGGLAFPGGRCVAPAPWPFLGGEAAALAQRWLAALETRA